MNDIANMTKNVTGMKLLKKIENKKYGKQRENICGILI